MGTSTNGEFPEPGGAWRELSSKRGGLHGHPAFVRIAHWLTVGCVGALFVTGLAILLVHPRLYWGEVGAFGAASLIDMPVAKFSLGKGWPRSLHFLAGWIFVLTGIVYVAIALATGHLRRRGAAGKHYTSAQRLAYGAILFVVAPVLVWTGLAMSPALTAVFPILSGIVGGQQSARTVHFAASGALLLFIAGHVLNVWRAGFRERVVTMIWGPGHRADPGDLLAAPPRRQMLAAAAGVVVAAGAGIAKLKTAGSVPPDATGLLGVGDTLTYATHRALLSSGPMAREFRRADISAVAPINGRPPDSEVYQRLLAGGFADWRLTVDGLVARPGEFTLDELKRFPSRTQVTHLACEEGWSFIAEWTGVRLAALLEHVGISAGARYVVFLAFDRSWNSLDLQDAVHAQTLLAYSMNGSDLPAGHGAPLRLHIPRQLGYKQTKYLTRILVVDRLEDVRNGLGALAPESGFSWYAGI